MSNEYKVYTILPESPSYNEGWWYGYNDWFPENPYPENSVEWAEWNKGYKEGSDNS